MCFSRFIRGIDLLAAILSFLLFALASVHCGQVSAQFVVPQLVIQEGHQAVVNALAATEDGRYLISGAADGTAKLWDISSRTVVREANLHSQAVAAMQLVSDRSLVVSVGESGEAVSWHLDTGVVQEDFSAGPSEPYAADVSSGGRFVVRGGANGILELLDLIAKKPIKTAKVEQGNPSALIAIRISPILDHVVAVTARGYLSVWKLPELKRVVSRKISTLPLDREISSAISRDGKQFALASPNPVCVFSIPSGQDLRTNCSDWTRVAFSPMDTTLAFSRGTLSTSITLIGPDSETTQSREGSTGLAWLTALSFSSDGRLLFATDTTGRILVLQSNSLSDSYGLTLPSGRPAPSSLSVSPKQQYVAMTHGLYAEIWDASQGQPVKLLTGWSRKFDDFDYDEADSIILWGNERVALYDKSTGESAVWDLNGSSSEPIWESGATLDGAILSPKVPNPHRAGMTYQLKPDTLPRVIAQSPDGALLVVGTERELRIFNSDSELPVRSVPVDDAVAVAISRGGSFLAYANRAGVIGVYSVAARRRVGEIQTTARPTAIAFLKEDILVVAGPTRIEFWNWRLRTRVHPGLDQVGVRSLSTLQHGQILVALGADVRFWRTADGTMLAGLRTNPSNNLGVLSAAWVAFAPSGFFDGTPDAMRRVAFRFGSSRDLLFANQVATMYFQPDLLADVLHRVEPIDAILKGDGDVRAEPSLRPQDLLMPRLSLRIREGRDEGVYVNAPEDSPPYPCDPTQKIAIGKEFPARTSVAALIEVEDGGAGVTNVKVFRNGGLVFAADIVGGETGRQTYSVDIPITPGINKIEAYALNSLHFQSRDVAVCVTAPQAARSSRKAYILAIGITSYRDRRFNTSYAAEDAKSLATKLAGYLDASGRYSEVIPVSLVNEHASADRIREALAILAGVTVPVQRAEIPHYGELQASRADDSVIIFYAGHGYHESGQYYLLPYNATAPQQVIDPRAEGSNFMSALELRGLLLGIVAERTLLIVDSCSSGVLLTGSKRKYVPSDLRDFAQLGIDKRMYVLTATQAEEQAYARSGLNHGVLTYWLLESLDWLDRGTKSGGKVTVDKWITETVARAKRDQGLPGPRTEISPRAYVPRLSDEAEAWVISRDQR